jgi:predicted RNA binding protein YcfA (HicA-like mRNA interferase family)
MHIERSSKRIIARLEKDGWQLVATEGSHHKFRKAGERFHIVVPHPRKDLAKPLARKIAKQAGWM